MTTANDRVTTEDLTAHETETVRELAAKTRPSWEPDDGPVFGETKNYFVFQKGSYTATVIGDKHSDGKHRWFVKMRHAILADDYGESVEDCQKQAEAVAKKHHMECLIESGLREQLAASVLSGLMLRDMSDSDYNFKLAYDHADRLLADHAERW